MPRISQLPAAGSLSSNDLLVIVSGSANYKIEANDLNLSVMNNDAGFITGVNWNQIGGVQGSIGLSGFTNDAGFVSSGTNISIFNNNSGFITGVSWNEIGGTQSDVQISGFSNNAGYATGGDIRWNNIQGTQSDIGLGAFSNNAGFINCADVDGCFTNPDGFISGVNWNEIGGTQSDVGLSGFNNDAGFITSISGQNLSSASNDAGFITCDNVNACFSNPDGFITDTYTPVDAANWSPQPTTIANALDQLALRVYNIENP
jgi:hypothetical protein